MADSAPPPPDPPSPIEIRDDSSVDPDTLTTPAKLVVRNPSSGDILDTPPTPVITSTIFSPITPRPPQTPAARPSFSSPLQQSRTLPELDPNSPQTSGTRTRESSDEGRKVSSIAAEVGSDLEPNETPSRSSGVLDPGDARRQYGPRGLDSPITPAQAARSLAIPTAHQEATATARAIQRRTLPRILPRGQTPKGTPRDRHSISPRRPTRDECAQDDLTDARDVLDFTVPGFRSTLNVHYPAQELSPDHPHYEATRRQRLASRLQKYPSETFRRLAGDLNAGSEQFRRLMRDADPKIPPRIPLRRASTGYADRYRPTSWSEREARPHPVNITDWASSIPVGGISPNVASPVEPISAFSSDTESEDLDSLTDTASTGDVRQDPHPARIVMRARSRSAPGALPSDNPSQNLANLRGAYGEPAMSHLGPQEQPSASVIRPEGEASAGQSSTDTSRPYHMLMSPPQLIPAMTRLPPSETSDTSSVPESVEMERSPVNLALLRPSPFPTAPSSPLARVPRSSPFANITPINLSASVVLQPSPAPLALPPPICPPPVSLGSLSTSAPSVIQRPTTSAPHVFVFEGRGRVPRRRPLQVLDYDGNPVTLPLDGGEQIPSPIPTRTSTNRYVNGFANGLVDGSPGRHVNGFANGHVIGHVNGHAISTPQALSSGPPMLTLRPGSASTVSASSNLATPIIPPPSNTAPAHGAMPPSDMPTASPAPAIRGRLLGDDFGLHPDTGSGLNPPDQTLSVAEPRSVGKGKRRAEEAALTPPSASARRGALHKTARAGSLSPTECTDRRVRFDDVPTPPAAQQCEDQTPATQELETPSTGLSENVDRDPEAEMDALLVELLAMEESERRGDDVTVWRRGLWQRYELLWRRISSALGDSPAHHVARALFQTPPAEYQAIHDELRDATPESAGPSGTSLDFDETPIAVERVGLRSPPPQYQSPRLPGDASQLLAGGLGILESTSAERNLSAIAADPSLALLEETSGPLMTQTAGTAQATNSLTAAIRDALPMIDDSLATPVSDWPSITLTSPTPVPVQAPQLESPFNVPDTPPSYWESVLDSESNIADDRLGDPARAGGWRRRASWAMDIGSFGHAATETGLLPSPLDPPTHLISHDNDPVSESITRLQLRPNRPLLRRNGFTMPDLVEARRVIEGDMNVEHRSASTREDVWPYHTPQSAYLGADIDREFLANLTRNAVMRRSHVPNEADGADRDLSSEKAGSHHTTTWTSQEDAIDSIMPEDSVEMPGYSVSPFQQGEGAETDGREDEHESVVPTCFFRSRSAPSQIPQPLLAEMEGDKGGSSGPQQGTMQEGLPLQIENPPAEVQALEMQNVAELPMAEQAVNGLPTEMPSLEAPPLETPPAQAPNTETPQVESQGAATSPPASREAGPSSPPQRQTGRHNATPVTDATHLATPTSSSARRERARRPRRAPVGLDEEARVPEPTGSSTLIDDVNRRESIYEAKRPAPSPPTTTAQAPTLPPIQSGASFSGTVLPSPPPPVYTPPRAGSSGALPTIGEAFHRAGRYVAEHSTPRPRGPNPIISITPPSITEGRDSFFCDDPIDAPDVMTPTTPAAGGQNTDVNFSPPDADLERGEGGEGERQHGLRLHDRYEQVAGWFAGLFGKLMHWHGRRHDDHAH